MNYIAGDKTAGPQAVEPTAWLAGADHACFLCRAAAEFPDAGAAARQNLLVHVGEHVTAVLNKYPYNNGHLLVSPRRHVGQLADLNDAEHLEAMHTLSQFTQLYAKLIKAEGFNIGLNLNRPAGAGVPGHLHWHLVPRWTGDSNFMPVTADARIISQSLDELWHVILNAND
jgi:ATP adenylyltransferase